MLLIIFIFFIAIPVIEIALFLLIGQEIGIWTTLALILLTAVVGSFLLQIQGLSVFQRVRRSLDEGNVPVDSVLDGLCLFVAGAFLITPGFLTDTLGFLLLIPLVRHMLARWVFHKLIKTDSVKFATSSSSHDFRGRSEDNYHSGHVIEGEYKTKEEQTKNNDES